MYSRFSLFTAVVATLGIVATTGYAADIFDDVPPGHWAYSVIHWAYESHIMTGPGDQTRKFDPNRPATRAEIAAVAARLYDKLHGEIELLERQIEFGQSSSRRSSARSSARSSVRSSVRSSMRSSSSSMSSRSSLSATLNRFDVELTGSEEVPSVATNMRGNGTFEWRADGLHYDISVSGNASGSGGTITGAHFHRGSRGQVGIVLEPITFTGNRAVGVWNDLGDSSEEALENGQIYVNVHTRAYPNGEIRGQLIVQ